MNTSKTVLITGVGGGIGHACAHHFAEKGWRVIGVDRADCREDFPASGYFIKADISHPEATEVIFKEVKNFHPSLDVLVNNAAVQVAKPLVETTVEEWDAVMGVNLRGCFLAIQACARPMRAERYGRIVLTGSITGPRVAQPGHGHYSASKAGINGLIRAAAIELAPDGITVNGIEPGNIMTEGMRAERSPEYVAAMAASVPLGRLGTPRDVAHAVLFLASDEAAYVTGTTIVVDGGQILPEAKA